MYGIESVEQALVHKKIQNFAEHLGMISDENTDVIACSEYILEKVSKMSTTVIKDFTKKHYTQEFMGSFSVYEAKQRKIFEDSLVCPLILGTQGIKFDDEFYMIGAVFESEDGSYYTMHVDLLPSPSLFAIYANKYNLRWYFNNRSSQFMRDKVQEQFREIRGIALTDIILHKALEALNIEKGRLESFKEWFRTEA